MYRRHEEMPMFDSRAGKMEAVYYNDVQTALKRLGSQIRLRIPELKHLDLILQPDAWIIVDRALNDVPIAAWTDFEARKRDNLHEAIPCEIRFYHYAARMVLNRTLKAMDEMLREALVTNNARGVLDLDPEKE